MVQCMESRLIAHYEFIISLSSSKVVHCSVGGDVENFLALVWHASSIETRGL